MEGKYQYLITVQFYFSFILNERNLHDEHRSSGPKLVKLCLDQYIFQFLFRYKR